ncbi:unnamed protein product [Onchocerca flexuosa]|uniref:ORF6C domain-containing protein n=1 Tax=Onchocerca flexuosa TaxID=387005 RepID=A0A183H203_9BILA|nr:unnamed protein product [Onchocerca flexuosa]
MKFEEQLRWFHIEDENMQIMAVEVQKLRANKIEQMKVVQSGLAKLEEKVPLANQTIRGFTLDKSKDYGHNVMINIDMERMLHEIMALIDKPRVLQNSIISHLKSLNDWKTTEEELEDEIRIVDNIEGLFSIYL